MSEPKLTINQHLRAISEMVGRLRELHYPYRPAHTDEYDICPECTKQGYDAPWPCPTAVALGWEKVL